MVAKHSYTSFKNGSYVFFAIGGAKCGLWKNSISLHPTGYRPKLPRIIPYYGQEALVNKFDLCSMALLISVLNRNQSRPEKVLVCPFCKNSFAEKVEIAIHLQKKH
jgi:hypothetical protein